MNKPRAIGAHIYSGGFTQGIKNHFEVLGHLETSKFGVDTAVNNLHVKVSVSPELNEAAFSGPVELVYGNPPCVAFSQLGHRAYLEHPTIADVRSLLRIGLHYKPSIWIWECVPQVWSKGTELVKEVAAEWQKHGYAATVFLTDSNLYGTPQRRNRFHLIAHQLEINLNPPVDGVMPGTCGDALTQIVPEVDVKYLQVRRYLQWMQEYALPGYPLRRIWMHLHGVKEKPEELRFCPPFCIQRLHGELPSVTLTGGPDFIHPYEWRVLSPGEMAFLCGFPTSWKWSGTMVERYKQVAKGVTPVIGDYLGRVFAEAVNNGRCVSPERVAEGIKVVDHRHLSHDYWKQVDVRKPLPKEWYGIIKPEVSQQCLS